MSSYTKALALWRCKGIRTDAELAEALSSHSIAFAFHSGKIENDRITFHDTREIFEHDGVTAYTGDLRTLFEIRNAREAYELFLQAFRDRRPLDETLIQDFQRRLTYGTYDSRRWQLGERPGAYKRRDYVTGRGEVGAGQESVAEEIAPEDIYSIPLYFLPMSAGTGQIAAQEYPEDFLLKKRPPRGTSFIARVSGCSMEPTYYDGNLVFVHATVDIRPGQTGAFLMDGQLWIKELGNGVLISHNPDYEPRQFTEDIRCQGLVLGVCDDSYFE